MDQDQNQPGPQDQPPETAEKAIEKTAETEAVITREEAATRAEGAARDAVDAHRKLTADVTRMIRKELITLEHKPDDDVRIVDDQAVMLFILPSINHLYIGFGPTGGREAYRGPITGLRPVEVAQKISAYLKGTRSTGQRTGQQVINE